MKKRNKKHIVVLATGGTISAAGAPGATTGYSGGAFDVAEIIAPIPNLGDIADVSGEQIFNILSENMSQRDWLILSRRVGELLEREDVDGVVITHGTDTLDETAYFLSLTVRSQKPVVVTGAMRPATATSADGPLNVFQSVTVAASDQSYGRGVMVVFADAIYSARDVQKTSTFRVEAFDAPDFGCLGYVRNEEIYFVQRTEKRNTVRSEFSLDGIERLPEVGIAYYHVGADPRIFDFFAKHSDGLVLAGCGSSTFSREWFDKLKELSGRLPVVRASRIGNGITVPEPMIDDVLGTAVCGTLSPQKARILLMLALTRTRDIGEIRRIFDEY